MKRTFILFFIFITLSWSLGAQSFYNQYHDRRWIASVGTGTTSYFGELNNPGKYFDTKPNLNIGLKRKISSRWSLRTEITWYHIEGSDAKANDEGRKARNLSFKSNNFEINVEAMWGVFKEGIRFYQRRAVNPYLFAGLGLTYFNPKTDYEGITYSLIKFTTEDVKYSRATIIIPAGFGVKFKIMPLLNINIEAGYRTTFTDYLDDVSAEYINTENITDPVRVALIDRGPELGFPPAEPGTPRGNTDAKDGYAIFNIKAEYYLPADLIFKQKESNQGSGKRKYRKMLQ